MERDDCFVEIDRGRDDLEPVESNPARSSKYLISVDGSAQAGILLARLSPLQRPGNFRGIVIQVCTHPPTTMSSTTKNQGPWLVPISIHGCVSPPTANIVLASPMTARHVLYQHHTHSKLSPSDPGKLGGSRWLVTGHGYCVACTAFQSPGMSPVPTA